MAHLDAALDIDRTEAVRTWVTLTDLAKVGYLGDAGVTLPVRTGIMPVIAISTAGKISQYGG